MQQDELIVNIGIALPRHCKVDQNLVEGLLQQVDGLFILQIGVELQCPHIVVDREAPTEPDRHEQRMPHLIAYVSGTQVFDEAVSIVGDALLTARTILARVLLRKLLLNLRGFKGFKVGVELPELYRVDVLPWIARLHVRTCGSPRRWVSLSGSAEFAGCLPTRPLSISAVVSEIRIPALLVNCYLAIKGGAGKLQACEYAAAAAELL